MRMLIPTIPFSNVVSVMLPLLLFDGVQVQASNNNTKSMTGFRPVRFS